jgi:hypothetical protein
LHQTQREGILRTSSEVATAKAEAEAVRGLLAAAKRDAEAEKNK